MHLLHPNPRRQPNELRQLVHRLLQPGQPQTHQRLLRPRRRLQIGERADIANNPLEHVLPAHLQKRRRLRRIQAHPQLIQARVNNLPMLARRQQRPIRIEQHMRPARLEIPDHLRQMLHQHRLAHPMQHHPRHLRHLVHNLAEQLHAHIRRRLQVLERPRTRLAQQIAPVRHLQIEANRRPFRHAVPGRNRLKIPARIEGRRSVKHHQLPLTASTGCGPARNKSTASKAKNGRNTIAGQSTLSCVSSRYRTGAEIVSHKTLAAGANTAGSASSDKYHG